MLYNYAFIIQNHSKGFAISIYNTVIYVLFTALTALRSCDNPSMREACTGALWETTEGKIDLPGHVHGETGSATAETKHVMISYQWDLQKRMILLKDELIATGYNVWMDVDQMGMSSDFLSSKGS